MINPEINADLDDLIESHDLGKRVARGLKRSYFNALARKCLRELQVDPLKVFGEEAENIIANMKKVAFSDIGELKVGNKLYRVGNGGEVAVSGTRL
jgi:hypothetical protein